jgi:hypothetical protein
MNGLGIFLFIFFNDDSELFDCETAGITGGMALENLERLENCVSR